MRDLAGMTDVLVAYASKRGSTAEIARAIAETLREAGLSVDCTAVGEVDGLDRYGAVVLGSAVYIKRWRRDAKHFLRKHNKELSQRPLWVFSSGPVRKPDADVDPAWLEPPKIIAKVEQLGARGHVVFGGRVPTKPRGPIERSMVENTPPEYRDLRDWDEIRLFAAGVASELR